MLVPRIRSGALVPCTWCISVSSAARPACRRAWTGSTAWGPERSERAITHTRTQVERYRLAISTHGNGNEWSNRFRTLLSSGAAVLKQARRRLLACVVGRADGHGGEGGVSYLCVLARATPTRARLAPGPSGPARRLAGGSRPGRIRGPRPRGRRRARMGRRRDSAPFTRVSKSKDGRSPPLCACSVYKQTASTSIASWVRTFTVAAVGRRRSVPTAALEVSPDRRPGAAPPR